MTQVVFDTNAYRNLVQDKPIDIVRKHFDAITGAEESKRFQTFMAPVPWVELFTHLVDPTDRAFDTCLKAVVASYIHTRVGFADVRPRLMRQYLMVVAQALFNHQDEGEDRVLYGLNQMAADINASPSVQATLNNLDYLEKIRDFGNQKKAEFVSTFQVFQGQFYSLADLEKKTVRDKVGKDDFFFAWVSVLLMQAAEISNFDLTSLSQEETDGKLEIIATYFAAPCYLAKHIMTQMITNREFNIEKKNRKNWYWDYQILFYISSNNELLLVSNDVDINDAAVAAGIGHRVVKLEDYLKKLQLNIPFSQ